MRYEEIIPLVDSVARELGAALAAPAEGHEGH
jgi:hypothetical protein